VWRQPWAARAALRHRGARAACVGARAAVLQAGARTWGGVGRRRASAAAAELKIPHPAVLRWTLLYSMHVQLECSYSPTSSAPPTRPWPIHPQSQSSLLGGAPFFSRPQPGHPRVSIAGLSIAGLSIAGLSIAGLSIAGLSIAGRLRRAATAGQALACSRHEEARGGRCDFLRSSA